MGLFNDRKNEAGKTTVPVWFMRQAGRYHAHYQNIKKDSDFMTMCKDPKLAYEVTMGPINEFDFDAAILFSDLLFPLEQLGLGLTYAPGPILEKRLETVNDVKNLKIKASSKDYYSFQKDACSLLRAGLPQNKTLLGFVGAPFTLYSYAVEGAHSGALYSSKLGLYDGRFSAFCEMLIPELLGEMREQALGGADAMCLFDTAAGELCFSDYKEFILPVLRTVTKEFKKEFPNKKVIYYSKFTHMNYLKEIQDENIDVLGVDWRHNLPEVLNELSGDYYIQGNLEPAYLGLPWETLEAKWMELFKSLQDANVNFDKWICGLGHGCLQWIPQENVRKSVELIHRNFKY
ncbi:uroporphyrinogen decarboxylase family protein [Bacteriovorax sp. Seq25_V]|uniref:uroporphyrinogen decarboxylase family protein n=1 Tax=Bacteriovorax sp. Seq25_V TaxID=1201288 RepID=UPI00038A3371|nr:uroporphyrinogen decarboxylase family protein [Bacteriovorax sp. Seq25_V]EQC46204.1 putative uroporphyrinogen decarboxylase [Bacteriovorax sp. Seq25_V]